MKKISIEKLDNIQNRILTLRGTQVMLDRDLAELYGVETKFLKRAVRRNRDRFPEEFCFQLSNEKFKNLRYQFGTSSWGGIRYSPFAFTEQGVAMLSVVLRSKTAIEVSIQIMKAFVAMRRFLAANAKVFQRLDTLELKQIETDKKVNMVLTAIERKQLQPKQGIFFDGQVFDAYEFISNLVRSAERSIILIDNYVDETVLTLFTKRKKGVKLTILTQNISKQLELDVKKFNEQYPSVELKEFPISHDRFLILDEEKMYHIGASLKDLGKKWFAFSLMNSVTLTMLERLKKERLI
ncbi:MAG: ORF6N domain-containing protein [Patescibacteria group bacterium]|nr:ORF6N domain-containing protein [Patescibacteria group bacterium]